MTVVPSLYVLQGPDKGTTFRATSECTVIGRWSEEVPLTDHSISRKHAELRKENGRWIIEDFHSSNGTYVNGGRIHQPTPLKHGDQIRLGSTLLVFSGDDSPLPPMTASHSHDLVELQSEDSDLDSAILASAAASDQSVILASPETYDAVHAWNVMYQLAETIGTFGSVTEFLEHMTDIIFQHLQVDRLFVLMGEPDHDRLRPCVIRYRKHDDARSDKITTSRRIIKHVLTTKEGVLCSNAQTDTRFGADQKDASIHRLGLRSVICVPILTRTNVAGIIHLDCSMTNHTYTQQQLLLATAIGRMAGMAIENARLIESRVEHERLAAVGETVAHLSHNIRNILQGMRSGADVVEIALQRASEAQPSGSGLQNIIVGWQIVQRNVERIYRLATNMLTFSKQREPHIEMIQLNTLVGEVVSLTQRQADDKGVTIETDYDELPPVPADLDGMHQVITNVLINAVDACPENTGRIVVRTTFEPHPTRDRSESGAPATGLADPPTLDREGADTSTRDRKAADTPSRDREEAVTISITDNGPGIPEGDCEKIFDPFHSTKGHGGTGLGLAAARKIIDELSGTITVQSSAGCTTFTVRLSTTQIQLADSNDTPTLAGQGPKG